MRIGMLGTGGMAAALGAGWARAGHDIMIAGRDAGKAAALAGAVGGRSGTFAEAAAFGDVAVVAVLAGAVPDVLSAAGPALRGKPVVDPTNDVGPYGYRPMAREIARLSGGHVVKAFNLCHVDVWRDLPPVFDGRALAVPLCGDDPAALARTRELITALGCTPVHGGGLERAELLEATAAFMIGLWFGGADAQAVLPPLARSGAHQPQPEA
jgi:predicted dinucleotide-binding enzyme